MFRIKLDNCKLMAYICSSFRRYLHFCIIPLLTHSPDTRPREDRDGSKIIPRIRYSYRPTPAVVGGSFQHISLQISGKFDKKKTGFGFILAFI